jgi:hypothetical protein
MPDFQSFAFTDARQASVALVGLLAVSREKRLYLHLFRGVSCLGRQWLAPYSLSG